MKKYFFKTIILLSAVFVLIFSAGLAEAATGSIKVTRIDGSLSGSLVGGTVARVSGQSDQGVNPASFSNLDTAGSYTVQASNVSGYTVTYGSCFFAQFFPDCTVSNFSPATCSGGMCSAGTQSVFSNTVTLIVFKYTAIPSGAFQSGESVQAPSGASV